MLVLQQLFNLGDEKIEFQFNDRWSFKKFVGLGVMNDITDSTTVAFLKRYLRDQGLEPVADKSMMPHLFLTQNSVIAKDNFHSGCSKGL